MSVTPYCAVQDVIDVCDWPNFGQLTASAQTRLINAASKRVDHVCRRPLGFSQQMVTETINGRNNAALWLKTRPIISVNSVTINGSALDNSYNTAWCVDPATGKLVRGDGQDDTRFVPWFPAGEQNIVVQYWAGYQTIPDEVVVATAQYVKYLYEQGKVSGIYSSESIGDYSYSLRETVLASTVPPHILAMLADYVQDDAF